MLIPVITEPVTIQSFWFEEIRAGMEKEARRKKYTLRQINGSDFTSLDPDALFAGNARMVVIIGTSPSWIPDAVNYFISRGIGVILVSYQPPEYALVRGVVRVDYVSGIYSLLSHMKDCGGEKVALYGCFPNSSADRVKRRAFLKYTGLFGFEAEDSVFENPGDLARCYDNFRPQISRFDSVICANDVIAASLINRLREDGVRVPEDLRVACFGGSEISRLYPPGITSLVLNNEELGRQAVSVYSYLIKAGPDVMMSVRVTGSLISRASTGFHPVSEEIQPRIEPFSDRSSFYDDEEVKAFQILEKILTLCDHSDLFILLSILSGEPTEATAENLYMSPETCRYRARRIFQNIGVKSRAEFVAFIHAHRFSSVLFSAYHNQN